MPRYPVEFRRKLLDLIEAGEPVAEIAAKLNVTAQMVYNWRNQEQVDRGVRAGLARDQASVAWASHTSFKPKDGPPLDPPTSRNTEVQWHGDKRRNDPPASTTDPEARLSRKSNTTAATLCYAGHLLMENRAALIVDAELTIAGGYAERTTAVEMLSRLPKMARRRTIISASNVIDRSRLEAVFDEVAYWGAWLQRFD